MGFSPSMDMCDPYKKRSFAGNVKYHGQWTIASAIIIILSPVIIVINVYSRLKQKYYAYKYLNEET